MSSAERIAALVRLVRSLGHEVALVGGLAVSIRARVRFTRDIDLAVSVRSDAEAEALAFAMQRSGFVLRSVVEQDFPAVEYPPQPLPLFVLPERQEDVDDHVSLRSELIYRIISGVNTRSIEPRPRPGSS